MYWCYTAKLWPGAVRAQPFPCLICGLTKRSAPAGTLTAGCNGVPLHHLDLGVFTYNRDGYPVFQHKPSVDICPEAGTTARPHEHFCLSVCCVVQETVRSSCGHTASSDFLGLIQAWLCKEEQLPCSSTNIYLPSSIL